MIDFACKQFRLDEIIKCSLGLSKADYRLMNYLIKKDEEWFTTSELAKTLGLNLTTIQRSVKKLAESDIIQRKQNNLSGGGYLYIYSIKEKRHIRNIIKKIIRDWTGKVEDALDKW